MDYSKEVFDNACEFIPNKLYFSSVTKQVQIDLFPQVHFFTIDHILVYINFYADFGPNNLAHVMRFVDILGKKLQTNPDKKLCLVSAMDQDKRANAAYLMCCYMMLVYKLTPEQAFSPLVNISPAFVPYRDAGYGPATYYISILDCLQGLYKGLQVGLLHLDAFNLESYEFYEKVENGDMNWITDKFLALASPKDEFNRPHLMGISTKMAHSLLHNQYRKSSQGQELYSATNIDNLIRYFKENNVTTIVRLNNKLYDRKKFVENGIEHIEMYFPDGSTPPANILQEFLSLVENRKGAIAVHCKAGLGRTGSLIAAYLIKHYRLTAAETISYLRVVRPGSVVGPQQNWLQSMQEQIWSWTPAKELEPEISLLKPSTLLSSVRFNEYRRSVSIPSLRAAAENVVEKIEYTVMDGDDIQMSDISQQDKKSEKTLKSHFKLVKGNRAIHKDMSEHMAVPIQPRKGLSTPSLDKDEPLAREASVNRYEDYYASVSNMASTPAKINEKVKSDQQLAQQQSRFGQST